MSMRFTRSAQLLMAAVALLAALFLAVPGAGAQGYPGGATFTTSNANPTCGSSVTLSGSGFAPNTQITLTVGGQTIGTATSDASGNFTFPWTVPCTQTGSVTVNATDGTLVLSTVLNVTSATSTTRPATPGGYTSGGGTLPRTGTDSSIYVRVGVLLVTVGGLLVLGSRKRSRKTVQA